MENKVEQYMVKLIGTRDGWPDNMTATEEKIMTEHYYYLLDLVRHKKVVLAGPVFDIRIGLVILQVANRDEAIEIMNKEPSVVQGVHTYEISPMNVSLLMQNSPSDRYVKDPSGLMLEKEVVVNASVSEVWQRWTSEAGIKSFFSENFLLDFRVGGAFEIYFDMSAPFGLRGGEDCKILSYLPEKMLSFEWNAPPKFPEQRMIKTIVVLTFEEMDTNKTKVVFKHHGWGKGEAWRQVYDYFDTAWSYVLDSFSKSFAK